MYHGVQTLGEHFGESLIAATELRSARARLNGPNFLNVHSALGTCSAGDLSFAIASVGGIS